MKAFRKILVFCCFILFTAHAYALPFTIVPAQPLPTSLFTGQTVSAYYTVSNNTGSWRSNNYVEYLPPNVSQVTSGGAFPNTCGGSFTLAPAGEAGSSCTLQLAVTGAVNADDPDQTHHLFVCFPGGRTCSGTEYPLSVVENAVLTSVQLTPTNATILYNGHQQYTAIATYSDGATVNVTNTATYTSSNPTAATVSSGGYASGVTGGQSTTIYAYYEGVKSNPATLNVTAKSLTGITVTPNPAYLRVGYTTQFTATASYNDGTTADVTNLGTWASSAPAYATITPTTGLATGVALGSLNITCTYQGMLGSSASQVVRYVYFGASNSVTYCQLSSGGVFSNCTNISETGGPQNTVNSAGTFVYFGYYNYSNYDLSFCPINSDGSITSTSCQATAYQVSTLAQGIALSPAADFLYVPGDLNVVVYSCPLNTTTGNMTAACTSYPVAGLTRAAYIAVAPNGNYLYILDDVSSNLDYCPVTAGVVGTCNTVGTGAYGPGGVAMNPNGTYLYVLNNTGGVTCTIIPCSINATTGAPSCGGGGPGICSQGVNLSADPLGTYLYIGNEDSGGAQCLVNNGTIGACSNANQTFEQISIR